MVFFREVIVAVEIYKEAVRVGVIKRGKGVELGNIDIRIIGNVIKYRSDGCLGSSSEFSHSFAKCRARRRILGKLGHFAMVYEIGENVGQSEIAVSASYALDFVHLLKAALNAVYRAVFKLGFIKAL